MRVPCGFSSGQQGTQKTGLPREKEGGGTPREPCVQRPELSVACRRGHCGPRGANRGPCGQDAVSNGLHGPFVKVTSMLRPRSSGKPAITLICLQFCVQSNKIANGRFGDSGGRWAHVSCHCGTELQVSSLPADHIPAPRSQTGGLAVRGPPGSAVETPRPRGAEAAHGQPWSGVQERVCPRPPGSRRGREQTAGLHGEAVSLWAPPPETWERKGGYESLTMT